MLPTDWYTCSADPDYFNACDLTNSFGVPSNGFGFQQAAEGNAYCGFYAFGVYSTSWLYKEYLGCRLINPMIVGHKYYVSFKINLSGHPAIDMAINNIGLLFSTLSYQDYFPYDSIWGIPTNNFAHIVDTNIITDTMNWTAIKGSIVADSAFQYILLGNFFDRAHTDTILLNNIYFYHKAYYFIDDVCVSEDSLTCNQPDDIKDNNLIKKEINIFPNPSIGDFTVETQNDNILEIEIINTLGRILDKKITTVSLNHFSFNASSGLYLIRIKTTNGYIQRKLLIAQ